MDFYEILVIILVAILVLKPEDVPGALYHLGRLMRKMRLIILTWQAKGRDLIEIQQIDAYTDQAIKKVEDHDREPPRGA